MHVIEIPRYSVAGKPKGQNVQGLFLWTMNKENNVFSQLHLASLYPPQPQLSSPFYCAGGGVGYIKTALTVYCTFHHMGP